MYYFLSWQAISFVSFWIQNDYHMSVNEEDMCIPHNESGQTSYIIVIIRPYI